MGCTGALVKARQPSLRIMTARIVTPADMWTGSQFIVAIPGPFIGPKATTS